MKKWLLALLMEVTLAQAWALPLPTPDLVQNLLIQGLPTHFTENYDFEGIIALSNCSGSLVRFTDSRETDLAMVLTNGHCLENGFLNPGEVVVNEASFRSFTVLNKSAASLGRVSSTKILYGTMTKTDMALYQLKETYAQIASTFNVQPLTLASDYAETKTDIEILSGYWRRGYTCRHDGLVHKIKEGDWTWEDSIRYSQPGCETIPGTSGSPIIERGTKVVIGVNNTGNESGEKCTENNPCEIDPEGKVTYEKGLNYGQQTSWIYSCLTPDHQVDLNLPNCRLPK
ncbi:serine protease [bacterium]|nr:serine protease [bacterium]